MYQNLLPLNPDTLQHRGYRRYSNYLFAEREMAIELAYAELSDAMTAYPLGFMVQEEQVRLMALLSVMPGRNSYVTADGRWASAYVPALVRSYPFVAVPHPHKPHEHLLCVDEATLADDLSADSVTPLFDDQAQPSEALLPVLEFWKQMAVGQTRTRQVCQHLWDAGLIQPWPIRVQEGEEERTLQGFYGIDEARLNQLPAETLARLRDQGALVLAYAHLLSRARIKYLQQTTSMQVAYDSKRRELDAQLDGLFGEGDKETLKFDF
ncbi:SapC protein [Ectothiorhodospira magna]|uniref:SapC protein n=1 Tax=Ectothiorhodospira magna TaxID=867345 RepID=A0A1H9GN00_9GAMM|nr:SapC family protein [Ectothiorhodospira magna]SEQ51466.1 SapC protein [Ectothiorhodospira magna]